MEIGRLFNLVNEYAPRKYMCAKERQKQLCTENNCSADVLSIQEAGGHAESAFLYPHPVRPTTVRPAGGWSIAH